VVQCVTGNGALRESKQHLHGVPEGAAVQAGKYCGRASSSSVATAVYDKPSKPVPSACVTQTGGRK
jgi:hypothetical protein